MTKCHSKEENCRNFYPVGSGAHSDIYKCAKIKPGSNFRETIEIWK